MSIEETVYTTLSGHAGLVALIGTRVYPTYLPHEATIPCVVVRRLWTQRSQAFGSTQPVVVSRPRFAFTCWALTHDSALAICAQVRTALRGMTVPVAFDNEYTLRDPASNYSRRDLEVFIGHAGE